MPLDVAEECFAAGSASGAAVPVSTPMACRRARTSPAARASPSHSTGCHSPASRPFWGRCCKRKPAGLSSRASVTGCSLRGLGAALRGSSNAVPAARAAHRWASGHFFAQGRTVRHADQRSQLHKGLIVVAGRIRRLVLHHAGGERFFHCRFRDGSGVVVQTGEHPQHIAVHGGHRMPKLMDATAPAV